MTSLGYLQYSDINDSSNSNNFEMNKKINPRNRNTTIKNRSTLTNTDSNSISNENVKNMLNIINNSNGYDNEAEGEDSSNGLADFNPPPRAQLPKLKETNNELKSNHIEIDEEIPAVLPPSSNKINNTKMNNKMNNTMNQQNSNLYSPAPLDMYEDSLKEGFNSLASNYQPTGQYQPYAQIYNHLNYPNSSKDQLLEKLNHMIHLLEEQKDEKTGHVMEEVILYSFLGVFIILIIDSFARAGKYTR